MSEEFKVKVQFKTANEKVIQFIKDIDSYFEDISDDKINELVASCPVNLGGDQASRTIPKKYKNSLAYALAETGLECEPLSISGLKKIKNDFFSIEAEGIEYDGLEFCKYFVTLFHLLGVNELSANGNGAGWEAKWISKGGKLSMKKKEYDL